MNVTTEELADLRLKHRRDTTARFEGHCVWCHHPWPCPTARLCDAAEAQQKRVAELRDQHAELMWKLSDIAHNSSTSVPLGMRAEDHYRDQLRRCIAIASQALASAASTAGTGGE